MRRRQLLAAGCAHCAAAGALWPLAARAAVGDDWTLPERLPRPDAASDEGGLWALMDREETRLRRSPFAMRDPALRQYLQGIACKLAGDHCPDLRVHAVRTPFFNASMAPNGMMQVWSGLLLRVENEAQLAAVLGHEIGHYVQRHLLDRLRDAKSRSAFGLFMAPFGLVGLVGQMAAIAGGFAFSREHEREADRIGVILMRNAGYDPREASKVWDNLRAELAAAPNGDPTRSSPMFATHPPSEERSRALAALSQDANGGFLGDTEFAAAVAPFLPDLLEDELKRGQYGETLILADRLIGRSPRQPLLRYVRAETRRLRGADGDADAALADAQAAVELGNEPAPVHRTLGYLHQKRGDAAAARAAFTRYLEMAASAPDAGLIRSYLDNPSAVPNS